MWEVFFDSLKDGLLIVPFLFLIYAFMETVEEAKNKDKFEKALGGNYAPLLASVSGIVPECGFSVGCAKLYDSGLIKMGTLMAAFLSASDEGLIVLISSGASVYTVVILILYKILYGALIGLILNILLPNFGKKKINTVGGKCIDCGEVQEGAFHKFFIHPLHHTVKTFIYVFIINFILGTAFYLIGEDGIFTFIESAKYLEPIVLGVFGIIPNCATSIVVAEAFGKGIISFSGLLAGLASNAGMGLLILFKSKKKLKESLIITLLLVVFGIALGYISMIA